MSKMTKSQKETVRRAMSILGKRMTPKRLKAARLAAAEMRKCIKPRKLNVAAVKEIRSLPDNYKNACLMAKKYKVNPTTVIRTRRRIYHNRQSPCGLAPVMY